VYPARLAVGQRLVEPAAPGRDDLVLDIFDWELSAQAMAVLNSECFRIRHRERVVRIMKLQFEALAIF